MALKIPSGKIPGRICKAAKYLFNLISGKKRVKEFELSQLIKIFEFLGAEYDEPEGSILRFDVSEKVFITIHKIHGKKQQLSRTIYLKTQNSNFNRSLRTAKIDFKKLLEDIIKNCKK